MEQAAEVYAILSDVYGSSPWSLTQIEADVAREDTQYLFVKEAGQTVGFLSLQLLGEEAEITHIAVKKAYQGSNYGSSLLAQLADRTGAIFLEVRISNQVAIDFYKKHGFVAVGRRKNYYQHPVEDALLMKREGYDREIHFSH